jgi:tRNA nucleotidyltransferase (CCA-adding enzyme)
MDTDMIEVAKKISDCGGRMYLVGGSVRDQFMNRKSHDEDYCITGLTAEKVSELFPMAWKKGRFFPVWVINNHEVALARTERKNGEGHDGFEIISDPSLAIQDDLSRRDLTINAMAIDCLTGEIIDPYGGRDDIIKKRLIQTSDAFVEDPLRSYRAARFAATLGFTPDPQLIEIMKKTKTELPTLSKERIFDELDKALSAEKPSVFFNVLRQADLLDVHFKELNDLNQVPQSKEYHPTENAYLHSLAVLDYVAKRNLPNWCRYAALTHDLGKAATDPKMWPHSYKHEIVGVPLTVNLSNRIGVPNKYAETAAVFCRWHMIFNSFFFHSSGTIIDACDVVRRSPITFEEMEIMAEADCWGEYEALGIKGTPGYWIGLASAVNQVYSSIDNAAIAKKYEHRKHPGKKIAIVIRSKRCAAMAPLRKKQKKYLDEEILKGNGSLPYAKCQENNKEQHH